MAEAAVTHVSLNVSLKKRSFSLSGHRTSVALEAEFWDVVETRARASGKSLAAFVAEIDKARGNRPLASALRLEALAAVKAQP
ncbi:MAG: ribbon-helix-helix domain-containing protein [Alphaproteobacteria bacterium]|nr:ribbon-helix-helix domain-containing protein [Alphaproteobacteria bacterium]